MTRWLGITRGRRSALAWGSLSTTAAEDNLNRLVYHERGRYSEPRPPTRYRYAQRGPRPSRDARANTCPC